MGKLITLPPLLALAALGSSNVSAAQHVVSYPVISPGQTQYVVQQSEASLNIDTLVFPPNFTLSVAPGVTEIYWVVGTIQIAQGATFDLSAHQPKPATPVTPPTPGQADYCDTGVGGIPGTGGTDGVSGTFLNITGIHGIQNSGGLWIKTDGSPGGDGGNGGGGQEGGGPQGGFSGCSGKGGGPGGPGGPPGIGGRASSVSITKWDGTVPPLQVGTSPDCGPSARPPATNGASGVIAIYGADGCDGSAGQPGPPGAQGLVGRRR